MNATEFQQHVPKAAIILIKGVSRASFIQEPVLCPEYV
ncbi:hypothetical protein COLU111180_10955 [Cohnella lubricantis]|nr:hypothetical protein [Cohnella lubricantis]